MSESWLSIETSATPRLGVSAKGIVLASKELGSGRQYNRALIPTIEELIRGAGLKFADLAGNRVGIGPGSYTGLRIGTTAAKALAYALEKPLIAVPSYAILANRSPAEYSRVDILGDALNRTIYVQRFGPVNEATGLRMALEKVHIEEIGTYIADRNPETWIGGPGATTFSGELPGERCLPMEIRSPDMPTMERVGRTLNPLSRTELLTLEPLYLRGSSAEERAKAS